ncbi:MAG: FkbM family methyltransferase [Syntrophales bacterium]|nr:FkbM family methyltransferase [Syntrophales bacterium]
MDKLTVKENIELLLNEPITSVYQREQYSFDSLAAPFEKSIVLFGAGGLGKKTLAGLRKIDIEPLAFADNNSDLWGRDIDGLKVMSVEDAANKFGQNSVFVIAIWKGEAVDTRAEQYQQLEKLGCARIAPFGYLYWKYSDVFLPHFALDMPHKVLEQAEEVLNVFSLWEDNASRYEYLAQLNWRMNMDVDVLPHPVLHEIYFPNDLIHILPDELFIDCGAYDGDTIKSFLNTQGFNSGKIIAFEPDPTNFKQLEQYVMGLPKGFKERVSVYPFAVGACKSKVRFESLGTDLSAVGSSGLEVDCVALDDVLGGGRPTYIKMDIEGSELDALIGAQNSIRNNHPILAISTYHRQDHLWRIPALIHSYDEGYRFFLRPHRLEVWDLVCYAIPVSRLNINR